MGPRSPMPKGPGRLVGCKSRPDERGSDGVDMRSLSATNADKKRVAARFAQKKTRFEDRRDRVQLSSVFKSYLFLRKSCGLFRTQRCDDRAEAAVAGQFANGQEVEVELTCLVHHRQVSGR